MMIASAFVRPTFRRLGARALSTEGPKRFNPIPVDIDHYTSGWAIEDIQEFTRQGKYSVQTYNQISTKVCIKIV